MSYGNPRINIEDSVMSMIGKMSGGNPGALSVLLRTFKEGGAIDPDDFLGGIGAILALDTFDIYDHEIWLLYKDVCGEDLTMMLGLLRAVQLGISTESEIKGAISSEKMQGERKTELMQLVRARLPRFGAQETQERTA